MMKHTATGSVVNLPRRSRGRCITAAQDHQIVHLHRQQRQHTAVVKARETMETYGRYISGRIVRRRLRSVGNMQCMRPLKGVVLLQRHRALRNRWARRNRRRTQANWGMVLFTDKKRFREMTARGTFPGQLHN